MSDRIALVKKRKIRCQARAQGFLSSWHFFGTSFELRFPLSPQPANEAKNSMTDRRRINGPPGGTSIPLFATGSLDFIASADLKLQEKSTNVRDRGPNTNRPICMAFKNAIHSQKFSNIFT